MTQVQQSSDKERAATALRSFAQRFGLRLETQVSFDECPGCVALGFDPYFGSPNGLVIDAIEPPSYEGNHTLKTYAYDREIFYSQVNASQLATYEDNEFIEMFRDWGYFGECPPTWLENQIT